MYHITDLTDFFYFLSGVAKVHVTKDAVSIHCFLYFFGRNLSVCDSTVFYSSKSFGVEKHHGI